jgi:hypothetical protein
MMERRKDPMKIVALAVAVTALAVATTTGFAQTAQPKANPGTKVYAYKQAAPKAEAPPAAPTPMATPQQKPFEYLMDSVPYGSQKWWEIRDRGHSTGGE